MVGLFLCALTCGLYIGHIWAVRGGLGEHPWVRVLASTKPYLVEACSDTWLSRVGTWAWGCWIFVPVPIVTGLAQVDTLFSHYTPTAKNLIRTSIGKRCHFFWVKNKPQVHYKCYVFVLELGVNGNRFIYRTNVFMYLFSICLQIHASITTRRDYPE
jgi:hypothetical protein